jgi:hypothetical protein
MEPGEAVDPFLALPRALALCVLACLPPDERARCAAVCRAWRAALAERGAWARLELRAATDTLLRGAIERADGRLQALLLCDCRAITDRPLLASLRTNGDTLTELRICGGVDGRLALGVMNVQAALRSAPRLRLFEADVACTSGAEAAAMLRNDAPYGPLRLRQLSVNLAEAERSTAGVLALAAGLQQHAWLRKLVVANAPLGTPAALMALVEAALALRLDSLTLSYCGLSPASAPALACLLAGGALRTLALVNSLQQLLDAPAVATLGAALRANTTLTELTLRGCGLQHDPVATCALLAALAGHASLASLSLSGERLGVGVGEDDAMAAALGALLAANAPALLLLDVSCCQLGDVRLGALVDALPSNCHLRSLNLAQNGCSDAFARGRLLPAVRANASLRTLHATDWAAADAVRIAALDEAQELVAARTAAGGAQTARV